MALVQKVSVTGLTGATSATATLTATTVGNSLIVTTSIGQSGSSLPPAISNGGTALTWSPHNDTNLGGGWAQITDSLNIGSSTTSVTLTGGGGGSGFMHGGFTVYEVSGGTASVDGTTNGNTASFVSSVSMTAATETGTTDFVVATLCIGLNSATCGISSPATGNSITYTSAYVEQDGINKTGGEQSYRIETSAVNGPTASWSWTGGSAQASAAMVTYKFGGGGGGGGTKLRRNSSLNGLGASGPFFHDPLSRSEDVDEILLGNFLQPASQFVRPNEARL